MNTIEDIEIYTKNTGLDDIIDWLTHRFTDVSIIKKGKTVHDLTVYDNKQTIPVMVVERAVGKAWTSIWFKSATTLWADDISCAQDINTHCHCRVRFNAAPWQQGADMDEWQQLDEEGQQTTIQWPNQNG